MTRRVSCLKHLRSCSITSAVPCSQSPWEGMANLELFHHIPLDKRLVLGPRGVAYWLVLGLDSGSA